MKIRIVRLTLSLAVFLSWQIPAQAQWIQTDRPEGGFILAITASGENLFAGTDGGGFYRSTNYGASWTELNTRLTSLYVTSFTISGTYLFTSTYGGVFLSTNNGTI
jgi:photosystem II stability/assembly factor-like uncharacterized protein